MKQSKANEDKESKSSDGFKDIEVFTFAKQTPKMKTELIPSSTVSKTPNSSKKFIRNDKTKSKSSYQQPMFLMGNQKNSKNSKSNEKKNSAVSRQITTQASKMLSYSSKSKLLSKQKTELMRTPESSIRSIKQ